MVEGSTHGLFISVGIVGSLYVIVFNDMCAITCVSRKGLCMVCGFGTICCQEW